MSLRSKIDRREPFHLIVRSPDLSIHIHFVIFSPFNAYMRQLNLFLLGFLSVSALSQAKKTGPVIQNYGEVYEIENISFPVDTSMDFKVVFDIMESPEEASQINRNIDTVARFLNMHVQNGVSQDRLKVYMVFHNEATKDILNEEAYRQRFDTGNPNAGLLTELMDAGVQVVLCGQSSKARNVPVADALPEVKLALSAMTAIIQLQEEGYHVIKF
jgi:intracellular sulfur oxidation DsrE/DsrF family protein